MYSLRKKLPETAGSCKTRRRNPKELDEAETDFKNKRPLSNASSALKVYNSKGGGLGNSLIVRSPINGEIISNQIVNGQFLKGDADPVVIIAELSKVWITGE